MRLVTRSDIDGLACAALLRFVGVADGCKFVHPKDLQDGFFAVKTDDVLANVPYVPGCGMWFDHHSNEQKLVGPLGCEGLVKSAGSCARLVWEYFGGEERFGSRYNELVAAVDKIDSGSLTLEDIQNPRGWVLLGALLDPRTGLGRYHDYRISNHQLMLNLVDSFVHMGVDEILALPDVVERTTRYFAQQELFSNMLQQNAAVYGNVVVIDLRDQNEIYTGNRHTVYGLYPQCNVSIQVVWGLRRRNIVFSVGYSIVNRTCTMDVGSLMGKYGGGGHRKAGACQVETAQADKVLAELIDVLK